MYDAVQCPHHSCRNQQRPAGYSSGAAVKQKAISTLNGINQSINTYSDAYILVLPAHIIKGRSSLLCKYSHDFEKVITRMTHAIEVLLNSKMASTINIKHRKYATIRLALVSELTNTWY